METQRNRAGLLWRVRSRAHAAASHLAARIRRSRRRARKSLRRARRMPRQRLLSALHQRGVPVVPYAAGSQALCRMWSVPALRRHHLRRFLAENPGHPIGLVADTAAAADLERFLTSNYFEIWRMLALSSCPDPAFRRFVSVQGGEHLEKAYQAGRGVVLVAAHYGIGAMLPVAIPRLGFETVLVASRDFANLAPASARFIVREPGDRMLLKPLMEARKALRGGACVVVLGDGDQGTVDVEIPFLGGVQRFARGFASLALAAGAPALPVLCLPGSGGHVTLVLGEPFASGDPSQGREARLVGLVGQYAAFLERAFLADPFLLRREFSGFHERGTWDLARLWVGAQKLGSGS